MDYDLIQRSIEEFIQANWTHTAIHFDNVAFNSDDYIEYIRCTIIYGDGLQKTLAKGSYRQVGLITLAVFTKPATGVARQLSLASTASRMLTSVTIRAALPLVAPVINCKVADLFVDNVEKFGWVQAQISCPFYYDLEY